MLLEKGSDGRLKRIEYRGKYLRASRTGGVALRAQAKAGGINFTANTNRGTRVSTRIAKGTQAAFQNGRFVLRGRYGDGPTKLNLSKSGLSVSSKNEIGTINWFKPRYSSVKIAGIQIRGKNAAYIQLIFGVVQIAGYLLLFLAQVCVLFMQFLYWLAVQFGRGLRAGIAAYEDRKMRPYEAQWLNDFKSLSANELESALDLIFFDLGRGQAVKSELIQNSPVRRKVVESIEACPLKTHQKLELMAACLASLYQNAAGDRAAVEKFFTIDEQLNLGTQRNQLQDRLLLAYAEACQIEAE